MQTQCWKQGRGNNMGQCYTVTAKLKYDSLLKLRNVMIKSIQSIDCNWHLDFEHPKRILSEEIFNAVFQNNEQSDYKLELKTYKNGSSEFIINSSFNQSYGWESLMIKFFEDITPSLRNGSSLLIYPDSDYDRLVVKNGECVQTH